VKYLLDTTFLIDCLRGDAAAISRFDEFFVAGDQPLVNEVVVCELATGARSDRDPAMLALLEPLEFIQPGPEAAVVAGRWRAAALRLGRTLSVADALIAAAAEASDATVLTRNGRDFALTPVSIESY
jgi:predicted nucleic acid-binding protein